MSIGRRNKNTKVGNRNFATTIVLLALYFAFPNASADQIPSGVRAQQNDAVTRARSGSVDSALITLRELRQAYPADPQLLYDETVLMGWVGRDPDVLANSDLIDVGLAPLYVLVAVAKAARNEGDLQTAIQWYALALELNPQHVDANLGMAMAQADSGAYGAATDTLTRLSDEQKSTTAFLLTEAYVLEQNERYLQAITRYDKILETDPDHPGALRAKALALRSLLLPDLALELSARHEGILTEEELAHLQADRAALIVRMGVQTHYKSGQRYAGIDRALAALTHQLATQDESPDVKRIVFYDRIVALVDRGQMAEAIFEFESMSIEVNKTPAYVLGPLANAYLAERRPEEAYDLLVHATEAEPGNFGLKLALFYTYVALEEHEKAETLANGLVEAAPLWRSVPGSRVIKANPQRIRAEITAALARAYSDQLDEAQRSFATIVNNAPHNTDARQELANVYRWRGWPDRALGEYGQVLAVEPDLLIAEIGYTHTVLDRRHYKQAESLIHDLTRRDPVNTAVADLEQRWSDHQKQKFTVNASAGESTGETFGSDQYEIDGYWHSIPIRYRYRIFAHTHDAYAEFSEGDATRRRIGAGVEYLNPDWRGSLELSASRSGSSRPGIKGAVEYRLNDYWSIGAEADSESNQTPLRGFRIGVHGDAYGFLARYAANELLGGEFSTRFLDLSDGNERISVSFAGRRRLISHPGYKFDLVGSLYTSSNSRQDVVYFSPERDMSLFVTADNYWRTFRRYDRSFTHRVAAGLGLYYQKQFNTKPVAQIEYEQIIDFNRNLQWRWGLRANHRVFDGQEEDGFFLFSSVNGRL